MVNKQLQGWPVELKGESFLVLTINLFLTFYFKLKTKISSGSKLSAGKSPTHFFSIFLSYKISETILVIFEERGDLKL